MRVARLRPAVAFSRHGHVRIVLALVFGLVVLGPAKLGLAQEVSWTGTYSSGPVTYTVNGSGAALSGIGAWTPAGSSHAEQGVDVTLGTCTANGSSATCPGVSGRYVDSDKTIDYQGTATLALSGNSLTVTTKIDSATPQWKPNVAPYTPAIHPGAVFTDVVERTVGLDVPYPVALGSGGNCTPSMTPGDPGQAPATSPDFEAPASDPSMPDLLPEDGAGVPGSQLTAGFALEPLPAAFQGSTPTPLALSLVDKASPSTDPANDAEVALVAQELDKFPPYILQILQQQGTRVRVTRGNITTYVTQLKGQHPRGWPEGTTWDNFQGVGVQGLGQNPINPREVVIATEAGPDGTSRQIGTNHRSYNLVLHEVAHSVDRRAQLDLGKERSATDVQFKAARNADLGALVDNPGKRQCLGQATLDYLFPPNDPPGGNEEIYADSLDSYYSQSDFFKKNFENLYKYWASEPLKPH